MTERDPDICRSCGQPFAQHPGVELTCLAHGDAMNMVVRIVNHHAGRADGTLDWHGEPGYIAHLEKAGLVEITERTPHRTKGRWRHGK